MPDPELELLLWVGKVLREWISRLRKRKMRGFTYDQAKVLTSS